MLFIRNLDSGMRRLGFLDVLITRCIERNEQVDANFLGERLGSWANKWQTKFLEKLAHERHLKKEVGAITRRTASRRSKEENEKEQSGVRILISQFTFLVF